jgi:hypothetical protein
MACFASRHILGSDFVSRAAYARVQFAALDCVKLMKRSGWNMHFCHTYSNIYE